VWQTAVNAAREQRSGGPVLNDVDSRSITELLNTEMMM